MNPEPSAETRFWESANRIATAVLVAFWVGWMIAMELGADSFLGMTWWSFLFIVQMFIQGKLEASRGELPHYRRPVPGCVAVGAVVGLIAFVAYRVFTIHPGMGGR